MAGGPEAQLHAAGGPAGQWRQARTPPGSPPRRPKGGGDSDAPTWQLPGVAEDGDGDEERGGPRAQEAHPPGADPQWALGGQLRPAGGDTWGQRPAHVHSGRAHWASCTLVQKTLTQGSGELPAGGTGRCGGGALQPQKPAPPPTPGLCVSSIWRLLGHNLLNKPAI